MKTCTKCGEAKALDAFNKYKAARDGRKPHCRDCQRAYRVVWHAENRDEQLARMAKWRAENPERRQRYTEENRDRRQPYFADYRARNADRRSAYNKAWSAANPDAIAAKKARRRAREANVQHMPYSRAEIFTRWGNLCCYCDAPAEHLDHVIALSRGGADAAHNLVPACAPCNLSKGARSLAEWVQSWGRSPDPT